VFGTPREKWLNARETLHAGPQPALGPGASERGRIAKGFAADLTFLDLGNLKLHPVNDPFNQIVSAEIVFRVGGDGRRRFVVKGGQIMTIDRRKLRSDVAAALDRLIAADRAIARSPHSTRPLVWRSPRGAPTARSRSNATSRPKCPALEAVLTA